MAESKDYLSEAEHRECWKLIDILRNDGFGKEADELSIALRFGNNQYVREFLQNQDSVE